MDLSKISFVDLETTGASPNSDRIIEIGILRVENGKLVKTYQTLINPETHLPPFIENMTGIHAQELENAPTFSQIKEDVENLLKDSVFVAHNVRFDYGFLKNEFKRFGILFRSKHFCTVKLSRTLYPRRRRHNLDSIIDRFKIECEARHRAYGDAEVLWKFYQLLEKLHGPQRLLEAIKHISKRPSLPLNLRNSLNTKLASCPGVYIFLDKNDTPLYIGKSINLKNRVLSHFSRDLTSTQESKIGQFTQRIELIPTAGELSALIKESGLIKRLSPLYNRTLRVKHELAVARKSEKDGYPTINLERAKKISPSESQDILATFRSIKQGKDFLHLLARDNNLCHKLLSLEKTSASLENTKSGCFQYRLGNCFGACIKKEDPLRYSMRFAQSFTTSKVKPWPFPGPIAIEEKHPEVDMTANFIVDKWCLIQEDSETIFDLDVYKILKRWLSNPKNLKNVKVLNGYGNDARFVKRQSSHVADTSFVTD